VESEPVERTTKEPTLWRLPAVMLTLAVLFVGLFLSLRLGDGSFDCPGNVIHLYRHPLAEASPSPRGFEGFDTARACNRAVRDRMADLPLVATLAAAAVVAAILVAVLRRSRR
jgi:hypothetical protein